MKVTDALTTLARALGINERGDEDDYRQMVADLISDDRSPFVPGDEMGLRDMAQPTLRKLRDKYLRSENHAKGNEMKPEDRAALVTKIVANTKIEKAEAEKMNDATLTIVANGIPATEAAKPGEAEKAKPDATATANKGEAEKPAPALSDEDREALAFARNSINEHRKTLTDKIVANSTMTADQLKAKDIATLEMIANGLPAAAPNYSGRPLPAASANRNDAEQAKGMLPPSSSAVFLQRAKGTAAPAKAE